MGRRKQSRPIKRKVEDCYEDNELIPESSDEKQNNQPILPVCPSTSAESHHSPLYNLENSIRKFDRKVASISQSTKIQECKQSGLGALCHVVGKISRTTFNSGLSCTISDRKESVSSILKCLQCGNGYNSMDQLVTHMQDTQHFTNLPKPYSACVQYERQKMLNIKLQVKSEGVQLKCSKCGETPKNMDKHLKEIHDIRNCSEWLQNVRILQPKEKHGLLQKKNDRLMSSVSSRHLNNLISLIATVETNK